MRPLFHVRRPATTRFFAALALGAMAFVGWHVPLALELRGAAVSTLAYAPDGTRFERVVGPRVPGWTPDAEISSACRAAVVVAEDWRFYRHVGIDRGAIAAALARAARERRLGWSGSTITQQLAKNLFLGRERSLWRKAREIATALVLDRVVGKERQLTWYWNVAELGPGIYGIGDAARAYFAREPGELGLAQCVALTAILPDPLRSYPSLVQGSVSRRVAARRERTLAALEDSGLLPARDVACAREELRSVYTDAGPLRTTWGSHD
jgi:membrane peptidoglycan carboxypeptidase